MEALAMSGKERRRLLAMERVRGGETSLAAVASGLGLSYRQAKRVWRRYVSEGDAGLVHRSRGKPSGRAHAPGLKARSLELCSGRYGGFGPVLACEHLLSDEGIAVGRETLRRWMLAAGLREAGRKVPKHRAWRERRPRRGELVQMDGSEHAWFGPGMPKCTLMVLVDDATNRTYARLYPSEDTAAAFDVFRRYALRYGLPAVLYPDRDSIYVCTREARLDEELRGDGPETQFARAMRTLGVRIQPAGSPQAKGRVERRNGFFQDRLVKELRLRGITAAGEANEYLEREFLPMLERRFTRAPADPADAHRPCPPGAELDEALCFEEPRCVANDWTVRWRNRRFQIHPCHAGLRLPRRRVLVRELLDGTLRIVYRDVCLRFHETGQAPVPPAGKAGARGPQPPRKPPAGHPWRQRAVCPRPPLRSSDELCGAHSRTATGDGGTLPGTGCTKNKGDISNGRPRGDISNGR